MPVHAIHLGNAWDRDAAPERTPPFAWRRRFGRPAGLGPGDRVFLVVERSAVSAAATLNGHALAPIAAATPRWTSDVTALLLDRNDLVVAAAAPAAALAGGAIAAHGGPHGREPLPAAFGAVGLAIVPRGERLEEAHGEAHGEARGEARGGAHTAPHPLPPPRRA